MLIPVRAPRPAAGPRVDRLGMSSVSITLNPVARISTSTSWFSLFEVPTPEPVILSIGSVTSRTLSRLNVERYVLWKARPLTADGVARRELVAHRVEDLLAQI